MTKPKAAAAAQCIIAAYTHISLSLTLMQVDEEEEGLLQRIHDISTNNIGTLCYQKKFE